MRDPAFVAYAINTLLLTLNLTVLWVLSGAKRGGSKTVMNPEDANTVAKGATVVDVDPPEVARVLRAHTNALVNIVPFLFLALVFVMLGPSGGEAWILLSVFTGFRYLHSIAYVGGRQPFRTIFFVGGLLTQVAVMVEIVRALLTSPAGPG